MNQVLDRDQARAFEDAQGRLAGRLSEHASNWTFPVMLEKLKEAIYSEKPPNERNPVRLFARRRLGFKGDDFKKVRKWLSGDLSMSADDISTVLLALNAPSEICQTFPEGSRTISRRLVDLFLAQSSWISGSMKEAGVKPSDVNESDGMEIRENVQAICGMLGIPVIFPDDRTRYTPVSRRDVAGMGLSTPTSKKQGAV